MRSDMLDSLKTQIAKHPVYWVTMLVLLLSVPFLMIPEIDLWISSLFADSQNHFWLKDEWFPYRLRKLGIFAPRLIIILLALFVVARLFWPELKKLFSLSHILFLLASAALGPGLLINLLLKANWGRARPVQTDIFGGDWPFSEIWVMVDHCPGNCSFVSGEGSMSFWLLGLVILLPKEWWKASFWIALGFTLLFSLNRIAFGGHYFSDILLSWALTGWVMVVLYALFRPGNPFGLTPERLEQAWDDAGDWLRPRLAKLAALIASKARMLGNRKQPPLDKDDV